MLNKKAFANSLAFVTAIIVIAFDILVWIAPAIATWLFNAQFLGADVASLWSTPTVGSAFGIVITLTLLAWIMGYLWAWFYNKLTQ